MNPIERQILLNQISIMKNLIDIDELGEKTLVGNVWDTQELLNPNKDKEDCCDMSEKFALEEKSE